MTKQLPKSLYLRQELLHLLQTLYPEPKSELIFTGDFQLLVSVMLSAQCTDKKVNQTTPALFAKFPSFEACSRAPLSDIEEILHPINYFRTKAKNLIGLSKKICLEFDGKLPRNYDALLSLPGVGNKTANVVLSELGAALTFPVDTHVFRVSKRLGLTNGDDVLKVESELKKLFAPEQWRSLHHWLIFHGRRVCKAQRPLCPSCTLAKLCHYAARAKVPS